LGLPGDTVEIKKGVVFLNGKSLASGTLPDSPTTCFQEILPGAKSVLVCREPPLLERFGPERVPDGHVFVLGDLRSQALHETPKSRVWGMIPNSTLRGHARWIWISTVPESRLAGAITSFPRIRFERILRKIE
jgi:signal peptidase I